MNFSFQSSDERRRQQISSLQRVYRKAIENNKEFSEVKKIYQQLKISRRKLQAEHKADRAGS